MKKDVTEIAILFEDMENNIRFIMDRRNKHYQIIVDIIESVKNITGVKIIVVCIISLLQIFLIRKFFNNSKKIGLNPFYDSGL
jgi:hypothetical protein